MELENKVNHRHVMKSRSDERHRQEMRFSSGTGQGGAQAISMPRRKSPSSRTTSTSRTQASSSAIVYAVTFSQTTREANDDYDEEMEDDESDFGDDTLTLGTSTVANSTICTSTLRFECLDLLHQQQQTMSSSSRNNNRRRRHQPSLAQLQEDECDKSTKTVQAGLTPDVVRAFMEDYYTDFNTCVDHYTRACWEAFFDVKYDLDRYVHIRPSGNPLDGDSFCKMMTGGNFKVLGVTLISLDEIKILAGGLAAIVVYTADQDFLFKGTLNQDRSITTAVIEEVNGQCKIIQEHRSTGQPRPTQGRWTC